MEKLMLWIKISSVAAVVSAVTLALVPESKLKNTYKTICGMIVIFSLLSAFSGVDFKEISLIESGEEISLSLEEKTDDLLVEEGENIIADFLTEKLKDAGFDAKLECILSEEEISRITVYGQFDEGEKAEIKRVINEILKEVKSVVFASVNDEE